MVVPFDRRRIHRRENFLMNPLAMIERAPAIVVDTIGNARTRHSDRIAMIVIGHDAIVRERKLLDHRGDGQLPGGRPCAIAAAALAFLYRAAMT